MARDGTIGTGVLSARETERSNGTAGELDARVSVLSGWIQSENRPLVECREAAVWSIYVGCKNHGHAFSIISTNLRVTTAEEVDLR